MSRSLAGVVLAAGVLANGCSVGSLLGADIPCASDDACPPALAQCRDGRCVVPSPAPGGEGEGEGEPRCGDGAENTDDEACDDGNLDDGDECTNQCAIPYCGDGIVYVGVEACDDGNRDDGDECTNQCAIPYCGDGIVYVGVEACDDGNDNDADGCTRECGVPFCGDGRSEGAEECDDGVVGVIDDCTDDCRVNRCGNGQRDEGESCDDGDRVSLDGCSARCDAIAWRTDVGTSVAAGPVLLARGGTDVIVVGTSDGEVLGLAANTGQPLARIPVGAAVVSVVVTEERLVAATASGDVIGFGFNQGTLAIVWRRDDIAVDGGRARLASVDDRVFFVMPTGGVRVLDGQGNAVGVVDGEGRAYTQLAAAPTPLTTAACDPCFVVLASTADDFTPPGAVVVPMGGSLAMWNVTNGCAPTLLPFAAGVEERARGRVVPSQSRTALVTSRGALVRIDASGNCADPLEGVRRVDGSFATEPTGGTGNTATWIVADATHLHALQVEGTSAVTELTGYPALLPQGRSVRVPAARDADGRFVVADNTGEVHVYERGTRLTLGTVGAPAAAGPLLVGENQPALVVVATTDGQVVAVEGGGRPATSGWHREAGDERGRAHASCAQVRAETMLALFAFLGVRRRRRCR